VALAGSGLGRKHLPQPPVSIAELGSNWQCNKTAFVLTTCTQVLHRDGPEPPRPIHHRAVTVPTILPA